ncbi:acyltransferase family protein [Pedobacter metabolipauper]|uniref:Peptidoglycan/LPS O-acetylase OafA/YrhL n=1 Tax=Pedobacter metabolipauper TaxID=425513 RepID=A0A4R6T2Q6_9SPHI|nr:acyltransferase [Pedobacter metabolipauper]TDQ12008.1 peptidoglycan/LPS O-acetylase OafA/YrhL [Pedobacter metabolipauper]
MYKLLLSLPSRLTRVTSGGKLIREIDGLRFVAILPVLIQHLSERFERNTSVAFTAAPETTTAYFLANRGFLGVYIFFAISGFVLALPFAAHRLKETKKVNIGSYFWRRLTRLEPPYIIWMTVFFLIFIFQKHVAFLDYLPHYLANITYTHAIIYNEWSPFNPPTWTLEIEVQFYILAPLLAYFFFYIKDKIVRRMINVAFIVILVLVQQYFKFYLNPYSFSILGHLHYFLAGFILADLYLCEWNDLKKNTWYDLVAVLALSSLIYSWSWSYELISRFAVLISLFIFFIAAFKGNFVNRFITNKWIMSIGGMCYTIYLIHLPFSEFFIRLTKNISFTNNYTVNLLLQLMLFIPVVLLLSSIFFLLFEKPFMDKNWPSTLSGKIKAIFNRAA